MERVTKSTFLDEYFEKTKFLTKYFLMMLFQACWVQHFQDFPDSLDAYYK